MWSSRWTGTAVQRVCCSLVLAAIVLGADPLPAQQVHSQLPRHPLEDQALERPIEALSAIETSLAEARPGTLEYVTLMLAKANACRMLANWNCQRDAGLAAHEAAALLGQTLLTVRGQIAEARGRIALQDFVRGEQILAAARQNLQITPDPELLADIYLAQSSLSDRLGKHSEAAAAAEKGLAAIGDIPSPGITARLWRNLARARNFLGEPDAARDALANAREAIETMSDPKLAAELDLELARLARRRGDTAEQVAAGTRILGLAKRLKNSQLEGIGQEVLGLAALDVGNWQEASERLGSSYQAYDNLDLDRDARRVLRDLVLLESDHGERPDRTRRLMHELIDREVRLERQERAQVGADFDAQLKYEQQNFELKRLAAEADVARAREEAASDRERLNYALLGLAALAAVSLGVLFGMQRFATKRLAHALAEQKRSESALEASERMLRDISDQTPAMIAYLDRDQRFRFVNAFYGSVFGIDPQQLIGKSLPEVRSPEIYAQTRPHVEKVLAGTPTEFETSGNVGQGERFFRVNYVPDRDATGAVVGFYSLAFEVTAMKAAELKLEELSRTDALTGLPNRRWFDDRLRVAVSRDNRQHHGLVLMYLDIDHFKQINDKYGHSAGDEVIRQFATRLRECVRTEDLVARIGGDEFVILAEDCDSPDVATGIARKVQKAMEAPMSVDIYAIRCTTSIGIAWLRGVEDSNVAIKLADDALYAAKAAGRNTWQIASTSGLPVSSIG